MCNSKVVMSALSEERILASSLKEKAKPASIYI
jgi:hypothetical protein